MSSGLKDIRYREAVYQDHAWTGGIEGRSRPVRPDKLSFRDKLARPEWVVEIEVTAVIPDDWIVMSPPVAPS